MNYYYHYW